MDVLDYDMEDSGPPPPDLHDDDEAEVVMLDESASSDVVGATATSSSGSSTTGEPIEAMASNATYHDTAGKLQQNSISTDTEVAIKIEPDDTATPGEAPNGFVAFPKYIVVFLVESTGRLSRHMERLKVDYLFPIVRCFRDANQSYSSDSPIAGWTKDAYYGFVGFSSTDATPGQEVNSNIKPTDNEEMALRNIDMLHTASSSLLCSQQVCLLEAVAAGMHCMQNLQSTFLKDNHNVEKHFILICQSEPLEESQAYSTNTTLFHLNSLADIPTILLDARIHFSLIATRRSSVLHNLVTSCHDSSSFMETSAATDERHLVLLNGISIRPPPPAVVKASPERIASPAATVTIAHSVVGTLLKNELAMASVSSPLNIRTPLSQQPVASVEAVTSPAPESNKQTTLQATIDQYVKTESPVVVRTSQPTLQPEIIPSTLDTVTNAVKSNESPRPQLTPVSVTQFPQGASPIPSYAAIKVNSPSVPVGSPLPQGISQPRLPIPIPIPNIALSSSLSSTTPALASGPMPLLNTGRPPHVSVSDLYNVSRTAAPDNLGRPLMSNPGVATSNAFAALQQNTGMLISQLNNPTSVPVPVPSTLQRCVVWDGIVEWIHPEGRVPRQMNQQPCEVWVPITDIIKCERWPSKLTIQFLPRSFSQAIHPFMADPVKIYFHFKPTPSGDVTAIKELHEHFMRKSAGATFGCIIIPNNQANPVTPLVIANMNRPGEPPLQLELRVIVFVFNAKVNHFQGWIPRDQGGFVEALRTITQITANQQQQQRQLSQSQMQQQPQQGVQSMNSTMQQRAMSMQQPQQPTFSNNPNMIDASQYGNMLQQQQTSQQQQAMQMNAQQQQQMVNLSGYGNMYGIGGNPQTLTQEQSLRLQQQQQLQQSHQQQQAQQQHMQRFLQQQVHQQQQMQQHQQGSAAPQQDPQLRQLLQNSSPRLPGGQL